MLHFIGHGDFNGGDGLLLLESDTPDRAPDPLTGRRLGVLLRNHLANLRLVFLNSCMGGAVSPVDPFGGIAQTLIRRYGERVRTLLAAGQAAGEVAADIDLDAATTLFIGTIQGLVMQSLLAGDVTRIRRDAPRVFDIYRRGIRSAA